MYVSRTDCRRCGQRILMIRLDSGKTMPCDIELSDFVPDVNGPDRYVMDDGTKIRGCEPIPGDRDIHQGHIDHRSRCRGVTR